MLLANSDNAKRWALGITVVFVSYCFGIILSNVWRKQVVISCISIGIYIITSPMGLPIIILVVLDTPKIILQAMGTSEISFCRASVPIGILACSIDPVDRSTSFSRKSSPKNVPSVLLLVSGENISSRNYQGCCCLLPPGRGTQRARELQPPAVGARNSEGWGAAASYRRGAERRGLKGYWLTPEIRKTPVEQNLTH